jgi:hypothetical protein
MSKLTDLVAVRNDLRATVDELGITNTIDNKKHALKRFNLAHNNLHYKSIDKLLSRYTNLETINRNIVTEAQTFIKQLNKEIYLRGNEITDNPVIPDAVFTYDKILFVRTFQTSSFDMIKSNDTTGIIKTKIAFHSKWQYPGLIIDPRNAEITNCITGSDPLYIASHQPDNLAKIISSYPALYQTRLRPYVIKDLNFELLPQSQFGFILVWDLFHHCKLSVIQDILKTLFKLLRPGGVIMFNFYNSDSAAIAERVDESLHPFADTESITNLIKDIRFNLIDLITLPTENIVIPDISVAIIKKPGDLSTLKGHQVVGEIVNDKTINRKRLN